METQDQQPEKNTLKNVNGDIKKMGKFRPARSLLYISIPSKLYLMRGTSRSIFNKIFLHNLTCRLANVPARYRDSVMQKVSLLMILL